MVGTALGCFKSFTMHLTASSRFYIQNFNSSKGALVVAAGKIKHAVKNFQLIAWKLLLMH
jgi:hypothetical protein